jgi:tetratricopeptide (TPR) repeat protein
MSAKKAQSKKKSANSRRLSRASSTPVWVRAVIIFICITFVVTSIAFVAAGVGDASDRSAAASAEDAYEKAASDALAALEEDNTDAALLENVGDAYYDWAVAVYREGDVETAIGYWEIAATYYTRSLKIAPDNPTALYAKATALYYTGNTDAAAALMIFVESSKDTTTYAAQVAAAQAMLESLQSAESTVSAEGTGSAN